MRKISKINLYLIIFLLLFSTSSLEKKNRIVSPCDIVDDVLITDKMLKQAEKKQGLQQIIGYYYFKEKAGNQIIAIKTGCCNLRTEIIIKEDDAKNALEIPSQYFVTKKGLKLGMTAKEVMQILGPPHIVDIINYNPPQITFKWQVLGSEIIDDFPFIPRNMICPKVPLRYYIHIDFKNNKVIRIKIGQDNL